MEGSVKLIKDTYTFEKGELVLKLKPNQLPNRNFRISIKIKTKEKNAGILSFTSDDQLKDGNDRHFVLKDGKL